MSFFATFFTSKLKNSDNLPKLELQLRRSLCWEDEGPESEDTVTEVELAPTEDIEDGGAWKHKKIDRFPLILTKFFQFQILTGNGEVISSWWSLTSTEGEVVYGEVGVVALAALIPSWSSSNFKPRRYLTMVRCTEDPVFFRISTACWLLQIDEKHSFYSKHGDVKHF